MPKLLKILGGQPLIQLERHEATLAVHLIYPHPHYPLRLSTVHRHYLIHLPMFLFQISSP